MNETLADLDPLTRLLFIGLWTIADKAGRLEDRPRRIQTLCLPYDQANVDSCLNQLQTNGFIVRYLVKNRAYIQVVNWGRHQRPHHKEIESIIPEPTKKDVKNEKVIHAKAKHESSMDQHQANEIASSPLIPDTLNLIPDTLGERSKQNLSPPIVKIPKPKTGTVLPEDWVLPKDWEVWTGENCPLVDPITTAQEFKDWARGNSNRAIARKADWFATWRNWCRRDNEKYTTQEKWQKSK